jgi:hypothetical protein
MHPSLRDYLSIQSLVVGCEMPADRLIHPSTWKVNAANFALTKFSEVGRQK